MYATRPAASLTSNPVQLQFNLDRIFKIHVLRSILLLFPIEILGPVERTHVWFSQGKKERTRKQNRKQETV